VEHQSSADLSLTLAIAREVGNAHRQPAGGIQPPPNQMYGLLESMDDGVMAWNEQGCCNFSMFRRRDCCILMPGQPGKNIADLVTPGAAAPGHQTRPRPESR
jgi:transcriptional activator for dhaKLM operon